MRMRPVEGSARPVFIVLAACLVLALALSAQAQPQTPAQTPVRTQTGYVLSQGQLVYVPAYGHTYHGSSNKPFHLTVTLSVHNTDPMRSITLEAADYYDMAGKLIQSFVTQPVFLAPLQTVEFVMPEKGPAADSGGNFLVRWRSEQPASPPLVETMMIGTASGQGISFTSRGVPVPE